MVKLIDEALYNAVEGDSPSEKAGYVFMSFESDDGGATYDGRVEFAIGCRPQSYERTGRHNYVLDEGGSVYMKDFRAEDDPEAGCKMDAAKYPAAYTGWIAVGSG
jgi:hypothetical protein